jgi:hypothetical protein
MVSTGREYLRRTTLWTRASVTQAEAAPGRAKAPAASSPGSADATLAWRPVLRQNPVRQTRGRSFSPQEWPARLEPRPLVRPRVKVVSEVQVQAGQADGLLARDKADELALAKTVSATAIAASETSGQGPRATRRLAG